MFIYSQIAAFEKKNYFYKQIAGKDSARTVGASRLDVSPSGITILEALLTRTVEATNPEPVPRFGAIFTTRGDLPKI
jgi:hypothetical protein